MKKEFYWKLKKLTVENLSKTKIKCAKKCNHASRVWASSSIEKVVAFMAVQLTPVKLWRSSSGKLASTICEINQVSSIKKDFLRTKWVKSGWLEDSCVFRNWSSQNTMEIERTDWRNIEAPSSEVRCNYFFLLFFKVGSWGYLHEQVSGNRLVQLLDALLAIFADFFKDFVIFAYWCKTRGSFRGYFLNSRWSV